MNPTQAKSQKFNCGNLMSVEFLPEELIAEVLQYLPIKSLMQLRCVCKAWNTLLSHPKFIKQHRQQSINNKQIFCISRDSYYILPFPLITLLTNPSIIESTKRYFPSNPDYDYKYRFIGSCNGLFCFLLTLHIIECPRSSWFQLWNPATNTLSNKFGQRPHAMQNENTIANGDYPRCSGFSFGYDNSTDTYKVVYFCPNKLEIFTFGGFWKIIQLPHLVPLKHMNRVPCKRIFLSEDVHFNDTINLLARYIAEEQQIIVIISLNLSTDTYRRLLPPQDFVEVNSLHLPTIHILGDSLCFSHHTQNTHFIIWKMSEFGIENSWTQFLKISYHDLDIEDKYFVAPLCLCESGIALVQAADQGGLNVILYHWSENRIEKTIMHDSTRWLFNQNHVETLAPTVSRPISST